MNRTRRLGRLGGLVAVAVAASSFAWLWVLQMHDARDPLTAQVRLDMAIWMAVFGTPWMIAAWLRETGARRSTLDGPGWLLAAAAAILPADRRDWGAAMAAELAQVQDHPARWRWPAACGWRRRRRAGWLVTVTGGAVASPGPWSWRPASCWSRGWSSPTRRWTRGS